MKTVAVVVDANAADVSQLCFGTQFGGIDTSLFQTIHVFRLPFTKQPKLESIQHEDDDNDDDDTHQNDILV